MTRTLQDTLTNTSFTCIVSLQYNYNLPYYRRPPLCYYLLFCLLSYLVLYREGVFDFAIIVLIWDLCHDVSMAFDAAASLADEMLLWSAGPLSVLLKPSAPVGIQRALVAMLQHCHCAWARRLITLTQSCTKSWSQAIKLLFFNGLLSSHHLK